MPGNDVHSLAGIAAGVAAIPACRRMLVSEPSPIEKGFAIVAAIMGSRAPDGLEPADSPEHRGFIHSLAAFSIIAAVSDGLMRELQQLEQQAGDTMNRYMEYGLAIPAEDRWLFILSRLAICVLVGLLFGYGSHLFLDGFTPKGLPLLGN